jgi:RHS repeat-associated protein
MYKYSYDAWNRLVKVERAYADPNDPNEVASGSAVGTIRYDGLGRGIVKQAGDGNGLTRETGDFEMTYHLYHDGQRIVEERNGSDLIIRQYVWGRDYVDELCQIGINTNPASQSTCNSFYYALHDPMYNVIGLVNSSGALVERYEYTPYGQRTVFISPGASDSLCMSPVLESRRVTVIGTAQPYGFCDVGHQGLFFDKEFGLVHNRARMLHPALGRFMQRDPIGTPLEPPVARNVSDSRFTQRHPGRQYVDGMNLHQYSRGKPTSSVDPLGFWGEDIHKQGTATWARAVGYTDNGCAEIIGEADNAVDWTFGGTAPRPFIGDMSYHFDFDKDGLNPEPNARQRNVDKHLGNARGLAHYAQWVKTKEALREIGTALHPLQDMSSHQARHNADSPFTHAPKVYCTIVFQDPDGTKEPWCIAQRKTNPNWDDPHRPDRVSLWGPDAAVAEQATKTVLKDFLQYEPIRCRCAPGSR